MDQTQKATFIVPMPLNAAEDAAAALKPLGIKFDPLRQIAEIAEGYSFSEEACGEDADTIRRLINNFLTEEDMSPLIIRGHLNLLQTRELLELAQSELDWHGFRAVEDLTDREIRPWTEIAAAYPDLFPPATEKEVSQQTACDGCQSPATLYDNVADTPLCRDCAADRALQRLMDDPEMEPIPENGE